MQTFGERPRASSSEGNQTPNLYQTTSSIGKHDIDDEACKSELKLSFPQTQEVELQCYEHLEGFYYSKNDKSNNDDPTLLDELTSFSHLQGLDTIEKGNKTELNDPYKPPESRL